MSNSYYTSQGRKKKVQKLLVHCAKPKINLIQYLNMQNTMMFSYYTPIFSIKSLAVIHIAKTTPVY